MTAASRLTRPAALVPLIVAIAIACFYASNSLRALHRNNSTFFVDLRPMYCAGLAMRAHADPYANEPETSCQRGFGPSDLPALPAPLPPYALELFALSSRFSFETLGRAYVLLAIATFGATAYWLGQLAGVRWWVAGLSLFWTAFYTSANLGQTSIFAIAAIAGSAYLVERERPLLAGLLATAALFSPTLALPLLGVLAITQPRSRFGIATGLAIVAALTVAAGVGLSSEYLRFELPIHARAEAYMPLQFSATWLAAALGMEPGNAVRLGSVTYLIALVCGIAASVVFVRRGRASLGILFATSIVTIGGSFIHVTQLAAALPLGFVMASSAKRYRPVIAIATSVLGVQWLATWYETVSRIVLITMCKAVTQAIVLVTFLRNGGMARTRTFVYGGIFLVACCVASFVCAHLPLAPPQDATARAASPGSLMSATWQTFNDETNRGRDVTRITALKALPWLADVIIVLFGVAALRDDTLLERKPID